MFQYPGYYMKIYVLGNFQMNKISVFKSLKAHSGNFLIM